VEVNCYRRIANALQTFRNGFGTLSESAWSP